MSLYHEAAEILSSSADASGSLKSRVFGRKKGKSPPAQLYALVLESAKWSLVLKEVIENAEILKLERKVKKKRPFEQSFLDRSTLSRVVSLWVLTFFLFSSMFSLRLP